MGRGPDKPGTSGNRFTPRRKEIYLAELRRTGRKNLARLAANVSDRCVSHHRKKDPDFMEGEEQALSAFNLEVHLEIKRRAIEGVSVPRTVAGERVDVREYSDRLLLALAKSQMDEYKERVQVDQSVEHSGTLALEADLRRLTPRGRKLMREIVESELLPEEDDDDGVPEEEAGAEAE